MLWGVQSYLQEETDYETAVSEARQLVLNQKIGGMGQKIIVVAGIPFRAVRVNQFIACC